MTTSLKNSIKPMLEKGMPGREQALILLLGQRAIPYSVFSYRHERIEHHNYYFSLGKSEPGILLCAHYDTFPGSPGANDDASGIAVLTGLYEKLKRKKLQQKVTFAFFDQEEIGCVGSRAFAEKFSFSAVISLELVGMGDVVGLWPITQRTSTQPFYCAIMQSLQTGKQPFFCVGELPIFYADFTPFHEKGVHDSFCMTMVPHEEIPFIQQAINDPEIFKKKERLPPFFQHYHTDGDNYSVLSETSLRKAVGVLENALLLINRQN